MIAKVLQPGRSRLAVFLAVLVGGAGTMLAAPPVITNQPDSTSVSSGSAVTFSATATGTPPLYFRWRLNGVDIPGSTSLYTGSTATDSFSLQSVQPTNAGSYSVVVWNGDGAVNSTVAKLLVTNVTALTLGDDFVSREFITGISGVGRGNNLAATRESGEPDHGAPPGRNGKPGNGSVWVKWKPPYNGIATFSTRGSGFDTTLGVYTGTSLTSLVKVAGDDDRGGYLNSTVSFNASSDTEYSIAMDGFYGARGYLTLGWTLEITTDALPKILTQPQDKTAAAGSGVTLTVGATNGTLPIYYQWRRDGVNLSGQTNATFVITSVTTAHVGNYVAIVTTTGQDSPRTNISAVAQLQLNSRESSFDSAAVAHAKFRDESDTGGGMNVAAPAAGYSGSQIFSTYGAVKEPGEPNHCDEAGGASYWYSYQPPADGTLTVEASAAFNSVLAIYTGLATDFSSLAAVACSSTNSSAGKEVVVFSATNGVVYYIVTDGVGGAAGAVTLTYALAAPPVITSQPASRTVVAGSNATLTVSATGTSPLGYQWRTNGVNYAGRTTNSVTVTNFTAAKEGGYAVVITNTAGAVTSATAQLYLIASNGAARLTNCGYATNQFSVMLLGSANTNYIVQAATNLLGTWSPIITNSSASGIINFADTNAGKYTNRFYRVSKP